jgi:hypothetical protein
MEPNKTSFEDLADVGEDNNKVLRLFNILSNLQKDADNYCKTFDELHKLGAIDDFKYKLIGERLSIYSLACKELGKRIGQIKRASL